MVLCKSGCSRNRIRQRDIAEVRAPELPIQVMAWGAFKPRVGDAHNNGGLPLQDCDRIGDRERLTQEGDHHNPGYRTSGSLPAVLSPLSDRVTGRAAFGYDAQHRRSAASAPPRPARLLIDQSACSAPPEAGRIAMTGPAARRRPWNACGREHSGTPENILRVSPADSGGWIVLAARCPVEPPGHRALSRAGYTGMGGAQGARSVQMMVTAVGRSACRTGQIG